MNAPSSSSRRGLALESPRADAVATHRSSGARPRRGVLGPWRAAIAAATVASLARLALALSSPTAAAAAPEAAEQEDCAISALLQIQASRSSGVSATTPTAEIRGARPPPNTHIVLYYVKLDQGDLYHNVTYYKEKLALLCDAVSEVLDITQNITASFFGSVSFVRQSAPACARLFDGQVKARDLSVHDLDYPEAERASKPTCVTKRMHKRISEYGKLTRIWLSKISLLCQVAKEKPDDVALMLDSTILLHNIDYQIALQAPGKLKEGTFAIPQYPWILQWPREKLLGNFLFDNPNCTISPVFQAKFLAVRGRDCPRFMAAYDDAVRSLVQDTDCGCFDEEIAIAVMAAKDPSLFDWQFHM